jgi:hypothetical protein
MAEFQWELVEEATNELLYVKSQLVFSEEILGALNDVIEEASYTLFDYSKMYNKVCLVDPISLPSLAIKHIIL